MALFGKGSEDELSDKFKEAIDYFTAGRNEGNSYVAVEHYSKACQAFIQLETLAKSWKNIAWQQIAVALRFLSYYYAEVCFCNIFNNIKGNREDCSLEEKMAMFEWLKSICELKDIKISETSLDQISKERFEYMEDKFDESTIESGYNAMKFMDLLLKEKYRENIEEMNQWLQNSLFSREKDYNTRKKNFKKVDDLRNTLKDLEIILFNKYGEFRGLKSKKGIEIYWDIDRIMMVYFEIYLNDSVELELRKQLIAKASSYIEEFEKYEGEIGDLLQMLKELYTPENVIHYGLKKLNVSSWKFHLHNGLDTIETLEKARTDMIRDIREGKAIPPYCKNCGSIIERGLSNCQNCGNPLEKIQIVEKDKLPVQYQEKEALPDFVQCEARVIVDGRGYSINKSSMVIGRSKDADIQVEDLLVSRMHARIYRDSQGQCWIEDTNSANGTFLYRNGQYKKIQKWALYNGDVIVLCYDPERGKQFAMTFEAAQEGAYTPGMAYIPGVTEAQAEIIREGKRIPLIKKVMTIGRSEDADIQVEDLLVSRMHARIYRDSQGQYWIEDTNSANGTFLYQNGNYKKIQKSPLYTGDVIVLCHSLKGGKEFPLRFEKAEKNQTRIY